MEKNYENIIAAYNEKTKFKEWFKNQPLVELRIGDEVWVEALEGTGFISNIRVDGGGVPIITVQLLSCYDDPSHYTARFGEVRRVQDGRRPRV